MVVGILPVPLADEPLSDALAYLDNLGVNAVEFGCGGYPGKDYINRTSLLDDSDAQANLCATLEAYDMAVRALATHNNPLHPGEERAERGDCELREAFAFPITRREHYHMFFRIAR
ncbi:hypothetical protein [Haloarcula sp. 1CSR25-25]|uniref:hypothetical protein n=1 Tax=Haloarcula sp. 1CSR25-25 TaxID=2862545 RepID=UPI002894EE1E|nr:hypothetical protein [Haloarcula sp. 1CSR25-25]MDT3437305.1 hypothetical protein [Haloarcula sp. 1CSR25-25]